MIFSSCIFSTSAWIKRLISTFLNSLSLWELAVLSLYPALIAACVPFPSLIYSLANSFCR
nr:MAG TPA: hypothetical protein [Caudoviricetes sp.]DAS12719.1 MAG TPA: hypothetical protein [Caudoviricetes sp.]DAY14638.1 MAG TPA: hypothetical protein [Caudoviricetes sp.]